MEVGKLQSESEVPNSYDPHLMWSEASMHTGKLIEAWLDDDTEAIVDSMSSIANLVLCTSKEAGIEMEGTLEEVRSYENIDTETLLFSLVVDVSRLGTFMYSKELKEINEVHFLNCMRDIAGIQKSLDLSIEDSITE